MTRCGFGWTHCGPPRQDQQRTGDPPRGPWPPSPRSTGATMTEKTRGPLALPAERSRAVLDEIERAVVGHRRSLELVLIGILGGWSRSPGGSARAGQDAPSPGRSPRPLGLDFARIQFTPDLLPSDVVGAPLYDQRTRGDDLPARSGLHPAAARRRDQQDTAENAGGLARGHGRGPGQHGRRDPAAAPALRRARHR